MALTDSQVKRAKIQAKTYQLADDDGLSLVIEPSGLKYWKYRYTDQNGSRKTKRMGNYPSVDLKEARLKRDDFKDAWINKSNIEPIENILLFSDVSNEWLDFKNKNSLGDKPRGGVLELAEKCIKSDINIVIGEIPFNEVKRIDLVNIVRKIESRGVKEPVKKACSYLNQIYDYAVSVGYIDFNIASNLNKVLITQKVKINYPHLSSDELPLFIERLNSLNSHPIIKKAIWLKLYTGVRGAEVINAKPENFDLEKKLWKIPAIQVKQFRRKALLGVPVPDYVVPLSDQAIEIVKSSMEWSAGENYLFASPKKHNQAIHFNSINSAIRKMGYKKHELSSHGLRSTMSTILNDSGLFNDSWIEAQLSHTDSNAVRGTYNHADYVEHRAKMMQWWCDYLDDIENNKLKNAA